MTIKDETDLLSEIAEALQCARQIYDANRENPGGQRVACQFALVAAWRVLLALPIAPSDLLPLERLLSALIDVSRGREHPLLIPKRTRGGQPLSADELFLQATSVSLTELLMLTGRPEAEAKEVVAAALARHGLKSGRRKKPISPSMIHNWRAKASSGDATALRRQADEQLATLRTVVKALHLSWPLSREQVDQFLVAVPKLLWPTSPIVASSREGGATKGR